MYIDIYVYKHIRLISVAGYAPDLPRALLDLVPVIFEVEASHEFSPAIGLRYPYLG